MIQVNKQLLAKEIVDPFFEQWDQLSKQIYQSHENRDKKAASLTEQGIQLFERLVVKVSVTDVDEMLNEDYEVLPINGLERLAFIKARPGQYACFRQLDELFKEIKKRIARLRVR